ncbi:hypothetical protein [Chishuiella changwenlii]|uniref:hypothetical protein n=1 Tax=Chishuiella changwenlii TaxID=1434701 RepID=UPI002FD97971
MIHCYDYSTSSFLLFNSTKDASIELNLNLRAVQKSIQLNYLVKKRYLFDKEEISKLNIEDKKLLPYYLLNSFSNELLKLNSVKEVIDYISTHDSIITTCDVVCHNIQRKQRIARKYYCSRDNNFSFIKK